MKIVTKGIGRHKVGYEEDEIVRDDGSRISLSDLLPEAVRDQDRWRPGLEHIPPRFKYKITVEVKPLELELWIPVTYGIVGSIGAIPKEFGGDNLEPDTQPSN